MVVLPKPFPRCKNDMKPQAQVAIAALQTFQTKDIQVKVHPWTGRVRYESVESIEIDDEDIYLHPVALIPLDEICTCLVNFYETFGVVGIRVKDGTVYEIGSKMLKSL